MIAASFWHDHGSEVSAAVTIVLTVLLAWVAERAFSRREKAITETMIRDHLNPVAETRLRLLRRFIVVLILIVGVALALGQFANIRHLATGLLASSAIAAAVIGFAARQPLANMVAGLQLAFSQIVRVGDSVTLGDRTGTVEDIRLTYTVVRLPDRSRLIVPNEHVASSEIVNRTISNPAGRMEVSVWVALERDQPSVRAAIETEARELAERHGIESTPTVAVAEIDKEGVRLTISMQIPDAREEVTLADELRTRCLSAITG